MSDGAQESKRISKAEAEMGKELAVHGARLDELRRDLTRIERGPTGAQATVPNGRRANVAFAGGGLTLGAFLLWLTQWLTNNFGATP